MYILGLTTLGDSAASLIKDGELIAAAEEERFSRVKHHSGFPYRVDPILSRSSGDRAKGCRARRALLEAVDIAAQGNAGGEGCPHLA